MGAGGWHLFPSPSFAFWGLKFQKVGGNGAWKSQTLESRKWSQGLENPGQWAMAGSRDLAKEG